MVILFLNRRRSIFALLYPFKFKYVKNFNKELN